MQKKDAKKKFIEYPFAIGAEPPTLSATAKKQLAKTKPSQRGLKLAACAAKALASRAVVLKSVTITATVKKDSAVIKCGAVPAKAIKTDSGKRGILKGSSAVSSPKVVGSRTKTTSGKIVHRAVVTSAKKVHGSKAVTSTPQKDKTKKIA